MIVEKHFSGWMHWYRDPTGDLWFPWLSAKPVWAPRSYKIGFWPGFDE